MKDSDYRPHPEWRQGKPLEAWTAFERFQLQRMGITERGVLAHKVVTPILGNKAMALFASHPSERLVSTMYRFCPVGQEEVTWEVGKVSRETHSTLDAPGSPGLHAYGFVDGRALAATQILLQQRDILVLMNPAHFLSLEEKHAAIKASEYFVLDVMSSNSPISFEIRKLLMNALATTMYEIATNAQSWNDVLEILKK